MTFKFSTGLRNGMMGATGFKALMDSSRIRIYAGTEPATADAALGGATLLNELTVSGGETNLTFGTPVAATIAKSSGESWSGTPVATGVATFFRLVKTSDSGGASTTDLRIQGTVGTLGADMNVSNATMTSGVAFPPLNYFSVNLPTG